MKQYGIYVQSMDGLLFAAPSIATAVNITGTVTWTGTTNATGYAKDINGFSPSLPYGSYTVIASKSGYNPASQNFTVPLTGDVNLTITKIFQTIEVIVSE